MAMRVFDTAGREYVVHLPEALRREMQARLATASAGEPLPPLTLAQDVAFSPEAVELLQDVAEQGEAMAFGRDEEGNLLVRNLATGEILLIESERGSGEMILYQAWLEANPEAHLELLEKELAAASGFQRVELLAQIHTLENTEESALALAEAIIELAPSNETPIPIEIDGKMYDFAWIQFIYRGRQYKASYWIDWILDYFGEEEGQRMIEEGQKLLPPPVIAGGGRDGKYFYLNPETGERVEFSTVFVPGKGEVDFYEVMMMDPSELANLVIDAIADEQHKDYWEFARQHYMAYPVVVVSSFVVNLAPIYQEVIQMGTPGEDFSTMDMPTNLLGIPFFDANTGELLTLGTLSAGLGPELSTYYINNEGKIIRLVKNGFSTMDNFGDDPQTKVGIILLGDTTAASYGFRGASTGVLELSPEYGAEPELLAVSAAFRSGDLETGLRQLSQLRGFVGRSPHIVAPAAK
ncbi:hypothetical protein D6779_01860 [Candidatus Parcubacteria bacterium]|nr:MAG: hypothetical protein D6779_01860 [Candidatus Parcubacteria bacterium]